MLCGPHAKRAAPIEKGLHTHLSGILGQFSEKALQDFKPENPVTEFKTIRDADWKNVLGENPVKTITAAVGQAAHMKSPEFAESLKELEEVPDIARIIKLSGINFPDAITHYNRVWARTQVAALGIDTADKIDSVLNYFHVVVPGYDWVKEHAQT